MTWNKWLAPVLALACLGTQAQASAQTTLINGLGGAAGYGTSCMSPNDDGSSNAMFMVTEEGVMVVDTQQHPADARRLLGLIRKVTDKPIKWVVVTHAHGDHYLGNPVFKAEGATFVSHRDTRGMMIKYYKDEVQRRQAYFKRYNLDQGELQMVLPDSTFDTRLTLHLGGRAAELIHLGPGQNPGDTLIHFPHARTLFLGGPFSRRNWSNYSFTP